MQEGVSRREALVFYYRHRTRLWLSFLLPLAFFIVGSFFLTPRYEASSVLIVRLGSEFVYQPEVPNTRNGNDATIPFDHDQIFKSEVAILNSDEVHRQVIEKLTADALYPPKPMPEWITSILQALEDEVTPEQRQQQKIARAMVKFDKRLDIALEKESAVITLKFQHADAGLAVRALQELLAAYMDKRKQLYLEPRMGMAQAQVKALHEKTLVTAQAVEKYKVAHRIYSLPDQRAELLHARADLESRRATVTSEGLSQKIGFYNGQLEQLDKAERDFDRLQHDKQIAEDEYALAMHKLNEAAAFEELQREREGSVRIIQPPEAPPEPKRWQWAVILLGFFVSGLTALGMAAATEFRDSCFTTPEKLHRHTKLNVLATFTYKDGPYKTTRHG